MISSLVTRVSTALLLLGGLALLFASDAMLPRLIPNFPPSGAWLGQLVGAAWLAMARFNWSHRSKLLGGIYGQPIVVSNLTLYLIGALVLGNAALGTEHSRALWIVLVPMTVLAIAYSALLFRGPFDALNGVAPQA